MHEPVFMELRTAWRGLKRTPGLVVLVVVTLALGIGATTTMFSLIRAVFLRPLPFPDQDRIVTVWESDRNAGEPRRRLTPAIFADLESHSTSFADLGTLPNWSGSPWWFNVGGAGGFERVQGLYASSGFFKVLGVGPLHGRVFDTEDDRTRGIRRVILSHGFWQTRFAGDPDVIGRTVEVDTFRGGTFTVVGVMPSGFDFPRGTQIWLSLADWGGGPMPPPGDTNRCCAWYTTFGRLTPGVTAERAAADLTAIAHRVSADHPAGARISEMRVVPLRDALVGSQRTTFFGLFGAVVCILLIGCANVANLLLARAVGRRREVATRLALGGTRLRIARQFLIETLMLGGCGAALGVLLSLWAQDAIVAAFAGRVPLIDTARLDWAVFAFAMAISVGTTVACGLAPLLDRRSASLQSRDQTDTRSSRRVRAALVVGEVALAVAVIATAGLLVRTVARLKSVPIGFDLSHTLVVTTDLNVAPSRSRGSSARLIAELMPRLRAVAGVREVAAATGMPLEGAATQPITRQHDPVRPAASSPQVMMTGVTPGYFSVMQMTLQRGRLLNDADAADGILVAVVNETAARRYWPGEDPIGKRFAMGSAQRFGSFRQVRDGEIEWREIVGVVSDVRTAGFAHDIMPEVFYSYQQFPLYGAEVLIRTASDPEAVIPAIRRELQSVSDRAVVAGVRTLADVGDQSIGDQRLRATLGTVFSGLALILGMSGVYGVMSYSVAQRTREFGIRVALGARRAAIARMVFGQALTLVMAGLVLGLGASLLVARWISALFFGVTAGDGVTIGATGLLLMASAVIAAAWPVRRALSVEPTVALRHD